MPALRLKASITNQLLVVSGDEVFLGGLSVASRVLKMRCCLSPGMPALRLKGSIGNQLLAVNRDEVFLGELSVASRV
jgi:hypothetical protein